MLQWTRHLQLQIGVVGDDHELHVAWTSQDGVVGSVEPDHLEGKSLHPIIGRIPKGDGQINLPKWHGLLSRYDAVERRHRRPKARFIELSTGLVFRDSVAPLPEHATMRAANHAADEQQQKKDDEEKKQWSKQRAKLQRGKRRQGSSKEEKEEEEEDDGSMSPIP